MKDERIQPKYLRVHALASLVINAGIVQAYQLSRLSFLQPHQGIRACSIFWAPIEPGNHRARQAASISAQSTNTYLYATESLSSSFAPSPGIESEAPARPLDSIRSFKLLTLWISQPFVGRDRDCVRQQLAFLLRFRQAGLPAFRSATMDNQQAPGAAQQSNYDTENGGHYGTLRSLAVLRRIYHSY